jgi:hypothetical protein
VKVIPNPEIGESKPAMTLNHRIYLANYLLPIWIRLEETNMQVLKHRDHRAMDPWTLDVESCNIVKLAASEIIT